MTPERCIRLAIVRALTWREERIATEHGAVTFRDLGVSELPLQAYLNGDAFDVAIVVARRRGRVT